MDFKIIPLKVAVRCRPLIPKGKNEGCFNCVKVSQNIKQVSIDNKMFTFDYVYSSLDEHQCIYEESVKPLVDMFFKGYNATVLAYGKTGSGKTYTMGGGSDIQQIMNENLIGIIPRVIRDIFDRIQQNQESHKFVVKVSYLEINGLSELDVFLFDETIKLFVDGSQHRKVASTAMNERSSRSHAIFTINIEQISKLDKCTSKLSLVDLAGSERQKKSLANNIKESIKINLGLLALGNVIRALSQDVTKRSHIPYRESNLTRLLQDSIGGNSHTLFLACVSSANSNMEETMNTLHYCKSVRKIKNKDEIKNKNELNEKSTTELNKELKKEISDLKMEMNEFKIKISEEIKMISIKDQESKLVDTHNKEILEIYGDKIELQTSSQFTRFFFRKGNGVKESA